MRKMILYSVFLIFCFGSCYKEEIIFDSEPNHLLELDLILRMNHQDCAFDKVTNTFRYSIESNVINNFEVFIEFQDYSTVHFNDLLLINNSVNNLGSIEINTDYELQITTNKITYNFTIQFTSLPIIQIITHDKIVDEPKTLARLVINDPNSIETTINSYAGIEHRGHTSQGHPKKSFSFSFLNSTFINDETSKSIFNLPKNSNWWLDAMYIDPARLRNKTSFDIWRQIEGNRNYGIHSSFVELYINSEHQGLYCLNESLNGELLGMLFDDASLYKAIGWDGTRFEVCPANVSTNKYWNDWEQRFPDPKDRINWDPLMYLTDLVVNHTDADFISQINEVINLDNFIDYYIFLNLLSAGDNTGKNTFLGRKSKDESLFIMPWDLEGSFGLNWNGDHIGYTEILSNNLYDRLLELNPDNFKTQLKTRWFNLRNDVLEANNLIHIFEINFNDIYTSNILHIENTKWNQNINILDEKNRISTWINDRVNYLDGFYANL